MSTSPPFDPGADLVWVSHADFVAEQIEAARAALDAQIAAEPDDDFREHLRRHRQRMADKIAQAVRLYYATGPAN